MNRLKEARKAKRLTQKEVADYIGLSQGQYSNWERGGVKIDDVSLRRLAELFEVSVDYLLGMTASSKRRVVRVPVLGRVAAGIPIEAIEDIIDYEDLDAEEFGDGEYFGLLIKGHSMEPKISDGDIVIVRRQDTIEDGEIGVVLVNGDEATVKRVKQTPQGIALLPNNPAFDPMYYTHEEIDFLPIRVVGRVVELRAKL